MFLFEIGQLLMKKVTFFGAGGHPHPQSEICFTFDPPNSYNCWGLVLEVSAAAIGVKVSNCSGAKFMVFTSSSSIQNFFLVDFVAFLQQCQSVARNRLKAFA